MMQGKTVLITGATGLLGSNLTKECLRRGASVIAVGRSREKLESCFGEYCDSPRFAYMAADISEEPLRVEGTVDLIFHTAGPIERKVIEERPLQVIGPNVFAMKKLLDLLYEQKKTLGADGRMVVFSSATVYGDPGGQERRVTERDTDSTDALDHYNVPYSQSKRMSEVLAQAYWKQYGVEIVVGRMSYLYGYNKHHAMTAFFEFMQKAQRGEPICINSTQLGRRDNIYVDDAVDGLLTIALKGEPGEAYNISSNGQGGNYAAVDEMANIMAELAGPPTQVVTRGTIKHTGGLIMDNSKIKGLGWDLHTDLRSGIAAIFEQSKAQSS